MVDRILAESGESEIQTLPQFLRLFGSRQANAPADAIGFVRELGRRIDAASVASIVRPTMKERINYVQASPAGYEALRGVERHVRQCGLDHRLLELIKIRVSQLNECAFCIDMHTKDARAAGESEQRLYGLSAWGETPFFDDRERAALAWCEAVTQLHVGHVPDAVYAEARGFFDERELVDLTLAIVAINGWNRLSVAFRRLAGSYQPPVKRPQPTGG